MGWFLRRQSRVERRLWFDSASMGPRALEMAVALYGADRIMLGTDWPHRVHEADVAVSRLDALPAAQRDAIRSGNAIRIFGL